MSNAASSATASNASRCHRRGASAGAAASATSSSARAPCWGCSSRSQFCASTTPGTSASNAGRHSSTACLCEFGSTENPEEIVAFAQHRDCNARSLQAEERRLPTVRAVDVDERRVPARLCPLDEAIDERTVEPRRHDDEVERVRRRVSLAAEQTRRRLDAVRLRPGEQLERPAPIACGLNALYFGARTTKDESSPATPACVRLQDRSRRPYGEVEDGLGASLPGVEHHGDVVARRVFELLHHQVPAPRRRPPVHLAQRVALDVVAHAVQIEATGTLQQHATAVACLRTRLGEEAVELD